MKNRILYLFFKGQRSKIKNHFKQKKTAKITAVKGSIAKKNI